jgi:hypothetical protein
MIVLGCCGNDPRLQIPLRPDSRVSADMSVSFQSIQSHFIDTRKQTVYHPEASMIRTLQQCEFGIIACMPAWNKQTEIQRTQCPKNVVH